jgi:hypothetical protein
MLLPPRYHRFLDRPSEMKMTIPTTCQPIAQEIEDLRAERTDLQLELQQAPTGQKAALATRIKALNRRIRVLEDRLADCLRDTPPPPPPPPPLEAVFTGTATITTTNASAPGPFTASVNLGVIFNAARTFVGITSFPPIATTPFPTPVGDNVTTVTRSGGGSGSYAAGTIVLPLALHFDQSIDLPFLEEDSNLAVVLSTAGPGGSPVDGNGSVKLLGTGVFNGGFLGGSTGTITIVGTISPVP